MTVNAFLHEPICQLSEDNEIFVVANFSSNESVLCISDPGRLISVQIDRKISLYNDITALLKMIRVFHKHRFDIVHSLTPKAGLLTMLAAYIAGINIRIHTFTGQVWATKDGISRWILKNMDRLIGSLATHLLADSPSQRDFLIRQEVIREEKSHVLLQGSVSGVSLQRFKPNPQIRSELRKRLGIDETDMVFLFIGRITRDKGVLDLAEAFSIINKDNSKVQLLIVGPDENNIRTEIKVLTTTCGKQVHFVDFTNRPQDYMAAADILCLPSYREGFGNVIIEAAATGIPAIGSRIYGVIDAIVHGETGLLFEPHDINELATHMSLLATNMSFCRKLGSQARERVEKEFSSELLTDAWMKYYSAF